MATSSVPRLLRHETAKQWARRVTAAGCCWSPREVLAGESSFFLESSSLTVKRSHSRFFMYEEHGPVKLRDDSGPMTELLQRSPLQLADLLYNDDNNKNNGENLYHYWTSPVADVAPGLLKRLDEGLLEDCYCQLLHDNNKDLLDPRGPSLWMASSGSATQAHYDVADNVILQLFGTKRVRCYPPSAARALHVFPDAHPRARKSQVNFDAPDHARFPNFSSLVPPVLDVVLTPGDVLHIPAFWFHHVENGRIPGLPRWLLHDDDAGTAMVDGPSVSLNMFALSACMLVAQRIFKEASRPFGNHYMAAAAAPDSKGAAEGPWVVEALRALGWALLEGLNHHHVHESPSVFIRTHLLDTRYAPLLLHGGKEEEKERKGRQRRQVDHNDEQQQHRRRSLTELEQEKAAACIARIVPHFESLLAQPQNDNEIALLVVCHLLELWAVELVGAPHVANAWEAALRLDAP